MSKNSEQTADVQRPTIILDEDTLRALKSFEDVIALYGDAPVVAGDIIGDGYQLLKDDEDKNECVGKDMLIVKWVLRQSEFDADKEFVFMWALVKQRGGNILQVKFTDGGAGIPGACRSMENKGISGNVYVPGGLDRSDYKAEDNEGNLIPATTFYLSTSTET